METRDTAHPGGACAPQGGKKAIATGAGRQKQHWRNRTGLGRTIRPTVCQLPQGRLLSARERQVLASKAWLKNGTQKRNSVAARSKRRIKPRTRFALHQRASRRNAQGQLLHGSTIVATTAAVNPSQIEFHRVMANSGGLGVIFGWSSERRAGNIGAGLTPEKPDGGKHIRYADRQDR